MKVNFWQVLGLILIIAGFVLIARKKMGQTDVAPPGGGGGAANPPAATMPAEPSTAPAPEATPAPAAAQ
jgi:hypothetical protein